MRHLLFFLLFTVSWQVSAQVTLLSIDRQTDFIEAKQKALLGELDDALELFLELDEKAPDNDAIQFELGRLYQAMDKPEDAIDWMAKAQRGNPNDNYAAFLAQLYEKTGRYAEGAKLMESMIKRQPGNAGYYFDQAEFLAADGNVKGAIGVYNALESRLGVTEEVSQLKHVLYLRSGDQKRAEKELLALVEAHPKTIAYRHVLAGYYESQGARNDAMRTYQNILKIEPNDVRAQLALQSTAPRKSSGGEDLVATMRRTDVDLDLKIGRLLPVAQEVARTRDAEGTEEAVAAARELVRVHPDEPKASALLGDLYFHTGRLKEAGEAYRTAVGLDEGTWPVWEQLLATLYLSNDIVALRKYAEQALDVFPNRPSVYVHYALGEALRANYGEATSLLGQAQLMVSAQPEAAKALATLNEVIEEMDAGNIVQPDIDLAVLPGGAEAPLGFLLRKGKDLSALRAYDGAGNTNALFLELLGDALAENGDKAGAAAAYGRARAAGSKSGGLRGKMAKVQ